MTSFRVSVVLNVALLVLSAHGCIYKYGSSPEDMSEHGGTPWTYAFAGSDWDGLDAGGKPWICKTGAMQSPINVPTNTAGMQAVAEGRNTVLRLGELKSNGSNVEVINNGHTIQVEWLPGAHVGLEATVAIPDGSNSLMSTLTVEEPTEGEEQELQRVPITPFQFHFHTHSEHAVGGRFFPLEAHIVSRTPPSALSGCKASIGCITVIGVFFELAADDVDNPFLAQIFDVMPLRDETKEWMPAGKALRFDSLLPSNLSYVTYAGSLTTPPCTENILWHLMLTPQTMSIKQLEQFLEATSDDNCTDVPVPAGRALLADTHDHHHHHDSQHHYHHEHSHQLRTLFDMVNRRLHEETELDAQEPTAAAGHEGEPAGNVTCEKMGAGENYRIIQKQKEHVLKVYVDLTSEDGPGSALSTDDTDVDKPKSYQATDTTGGNYRGYMQSAGWFLLALPVLLLVLCNLDLAAVWGGKEIKPDPRDV